MGQLWASRNVRKKSGTDLQCKQKGAEGDVSSSCQVPPLFDRPAEADVLWCIEHGGLDHRDEQDMARNEPGDQEPAEDCVCHQLAHFDVAQHFCQLE